MKKKILIITELDFDIFKIIKKELINKLKNKKIKNKLNNKLIYYKIEYLNLNKINKQSLLLRNKKIKYSENIIFLINSNLLEIKKLNEIINLIKLNYYIKNKKINIIFSGNIDNSVDLNILKNIFKNYNILGKINFDKKELINQKKINKIKFI